MLNIKEIFDLKKNGIYWISGFASLFFVTLVFGIYFYNFHWGLSPDPDKWGGFGDFVGGTLSAILSLMSFLALLLTIKLQADQLRLTREELADSKSERDEQFEMLQDQNFKNTFFELIKLHNSIVNDLDLRNRQTGELTIKGRDCFKVYIQRLNTIIKKIPIEKFDKAYGEFHRTNQADVGHYFRNLYTILKYIKHSSVKDKKFYTNIVRAQLSSYELLLLFYNCLSKVGREKFKPIVEEFSFLKNINKDEIIYPELIGRFDKKTFE